MTGSFTWILMNVCRQSFAGKLKRRSAAPMWTGCAFIGTISFCIGQFAEEVGNYIPISM